MFIIFNKTTKDILSYGVGFPVLTESDGKLLIGNTVICNSLEICDWKYIAEQATEPTGDADTYLEATKPLTGDEVREQLEAINAVILDIILGA